MKISIVTTCLNSQGTIKETIRSVLDQKGDFEVEYIITDAGSTDGTIDIIKSFGSKIKLVDAKGTNQSEGINMGIKLATGDILAFINADDVYEPCAFQKVQQAFAGDPNTLWVTGQCRIIDKDGHEISKFITRYKNFLLKRFSYFLLLSL